MNTPRNGLPHRHPQDLDYAGLRYDVGRIAASLHGGASFLHPLSFRHLIPRALVDPVQSVRTSAGVPVRMWAEGFETGSRFTVAAAIGRTVVRAGRALGGEYCVFAGPGTPEGLEVGPAAAWWAEAGRLWSDSRGAEGGVAHPDVPLEGPFLEFAKAVREVRYMAEKRALANSGVSA